MAVGQGALLANTSASGNTAVGYNGGIATTTGAANVYVGISAGSYANAHTTGSGATYLGAYAHPSAVGVSNELVIAAGGLQAGKGTNTGFISPNTGGVYQGNNASTWSQTSDRRLKKNIVDSTIGLAEINQLQVRNFEYRTADEVTELEAHTVIKNSGVQVGVIAQEIKEILPKCVKEESTGVLSVDANNLTWHMVKAVQELSTALDAALARIATLEG